MPRFGYSLAIAALVLVWTVASHAGDDTFAITEAMLGTHEACYGTLNGSRREPLHPIPANKLELLQPETLAKLENVTYLCDEGTAGEPYLVWREPLGDEAKRGHRYVLSQQGITPMRVASRFVPQALGTPRLKKIPASLVDLDDRGPPERHSVWCGDRIAVTQDADRKFEFWEQGWMLLADEAQSYEVRTLDFKECNLHTCYNVILEDGERVGRYQPNEPEPNPDESDADFLAREHRRFAKLGKSRVDRERSFHVTFRPGGERFMVVAWNDDIGGLGWVKFALLHFDEHRGAWRERARIVAEDI